MNDNRWILISFRQSSVIINGDNKKYCTKHELELIDLKEKKIGNRSQKLSLILPDTFTLRHIYATINSNNQTSIYLKIVEQFTREIEKKLKLSLSMPIVLIQLINHYYYCSAFQIWFFGVHSNMILWDYDRFKFKRDILVFNYDDLW